MATARPLSKFRQIRRDRDAGKVENVAVNANRGKEFIFLMPFPTTFVFSGLVPLWGVCFFLENGLRPGLVGSIRFQPLLLVIPATAGASCAFMLPVATPPNAIVYGSGLISIPQMARAGFIFNILMVFIITGMMYLLLGHVFNVLWRTWPLA